MGTRSEPGGADYLRAAESALADGELALAEKRGEEALRTCGPGDARTQAEAESFLGNIALRREIPDQAERHYRRAAELFDALEDHIAVGRSLAALGGLLLDQGRYVDAVEEWQGAVRRLAGDLTAQIELARALSYSGQVGAALGVYGSVLDVAPESAEALAGRGQLLVDRGDPTAALADFDRLAALHPGRAAGPDVRSARAVALAELGRADEAADELSEALRDAPNHGTVLLQAARMARAAGDLADAAELARRAGAANGPRLLPHELAEAQRIAGR
jgi:tetratricopeptide (TPR) repeat protein